MATLEPFLRLFTNEVGAEKANLAPSTLSTLPKWEIMPVNINVATAGIELIEPEALRAEGLRLLWQGWDIHLRCSIALL